MKKQLLPVSLRWPTVLVMMFCASLSIPTMTSAAEIFKWTDAEGNVHFGDQPEGNNAQGVEVQAAPPADPTVSERLDSQNKLSEARAKDREMTKKESEKLAAAAKEKAERCKQITENLDLLNLQRPIYTVDEKQERHYLSDEERAKQKDELNKMKQSFCK